MNVPTSTSSAPHTVPQDSPSIAAAPADSACPVAIVTGAGSGIGRASARLLSAGGYRLILLGRRRLALEETGSTLAGPWTATELDLCDAGAIWRCVANLDQQFGRIDVVVNNAGDAPLASIDRSTPELIEQSYRVNAMAPANMIAAAWPIFQRQRRGCVVNVSSMATIDPFPGFFAYAGAKASCNLMVRSCAKEGRTIGVRAFAVAPGAVETAMLRQNFTEKMLPARKCLSPDAVAQVIVECVRGERDGQNGETIVIPSP